MAYLTQYDIDVVTTTSGTTADGVAYTTRPLNGYLHAIKYAAGSTAISTTAELTVVTTGGIPILSSLAVGGSQTWYPRAAVCNTTNTAQTAFDRIVLPNEKVKVAIKNAAAAGQGGTYTVYVDGAG
jgi:hypothetical protein